MNQNGLHEGTDTYIPDVVHIEVKALLGSEHTQTHRRELIFRAIFEKIAKNPQTEITAQQLALIARGYANTLLLEDIENQHTALLEEKWVGLKRSNEDLSGELSYALLRLINRDDIDKLANAEVYFTDTETNFLSQPNATIKRCSSRGRLYSVETKPDGTHKFTFFIRRTSTLKTSTDALEIMSLISVIELARQRMKKLPFKSKRITTATGEIKSRTPYKDELNALTGKKWSTEAVKNWAKGNGITICGTELGLQDYKTAPKLEATVHFHTVERIKEKLETLQLAVPETAILGNDFALPILAATGIFTREDLLSLQQDTTIPDPLEALNGTIKPERLSETQKEIVRRYGYLQFINRYAGDNPEYLEFKTRMQSVINSLKSPLFSATETALADQIDYYDFSNLDQTYIERIPEESIRTMLLKAKEKKFTALNFSYPLGDNTYGLVKSLHKVMGIENYGFFGKVGATIDFLEGGITSGVKVGRLVLPENTIPNEPNAECKTFLNHTLNTDVLLIPASDSTEVILQVNGVLLQTIEDIKFLRDKLLSGDILLKDTDEQNINPKKIRILLDMESHHLHTACDELGIWPSVCYYTSDNMKIPPTTVKQSHENTLVTSLGARGSFAVLVSGATVLYDLLKRLFPD